MSAYGGCPGVRCREPSGPKACHISLPAAGYIRSFSRCCEFIPQPTVRMILPIGKHKCIFTLASIPESYELLSAVAGLLTYSPRPVFPSAGRRTVTYVWTSVIGAYSCGTAPDLHRIPILILCRKSRQRNQRGANIDNKSKKPRRKDPHGFCPTKNQTIKLLVLYIYSALFFDLEYTSQLSIPVLRNTIFLFASSSVT